MVYLEYHAIRSKYHDAQTKLDALLDEKERLFSKTQPGAIRYDKDRIQTSGDRNTFDEYLIAKERLHLDERIAEQKEITESRRRLRELKEQELRASREWSDRIYTLYFLDRFSITMIEKRIPYSRVQIWRYIQGIRENLKNL